MTELLEGKKGLSKDRDKMRQATDSIKDDINFMLISETNDDDGLVLDKVAAITAMDGRNMTGCIRGLKHFLGWG